MGAQAFPETDYAPTELDAQAFQEYDVDLFRDLQSDFGTRSDLETKEARKQTRISLAKRDSNSPVRNRYLPNLKKESDDKN